MGGHIDAIVPGVGIRTGCSDQFQAVVQAQIQGRWQSCIEERDMRYFHGIPFDAFADVHLDNDGFSHSGNGSAGRLRAHGIAPADPRGGRIAVSAVESDGLGIAEQYIRSEIYALVGRILHIEVIVERAVGRGDFHRIQARFVDGQCVGVGSVVPEPRNVAACPIGIHRGGGFHLFQAQDDGIFFPFDFVGRIMREFHFVARGANA